MDTVPTPLSSFMWSQFQSHHSPHHSVILVRILYSCSTLPGVYVSVATWLECDLLLITLSFVFQTVLILAARTASRLVFMNMSFIDIPLPDTSGLTSNNGKVGLQPNFTESTVGHSVACTTADTCRFNYHALHMFLCNYTIILAQLPMCHQFSATRIFNANSILDSSRPHFSCLSHHRWRPLVHSQLHNSQCQGTRPANALSYCYYSPGLQKLN